jgi:hypothetical protein
MRTKELCKLTPCSGEGRKSGLSWMNVLRVVASSVRCCTGGKGHVELRWQRDGWVGDGVAADEESGVVAVVGPGFGKRGVWHKR